MPLLARLPLFDREKHDFEGIGIRKSLVLWH